MIAGYIDHDEHVFCAECWIDQRKPGSSPERLLDTEDPDDPRNNFWIVDTCASCGREVKYLEIRVLD